MCCELVVKVVSLLRINFSFILKSFDNKTATSPRQCCIVTIMDLLWIKFSISATSLQQFHRLGNMSTTVYAYEDTFKTGFHIKSSCYKPVDLF